jgi:hypothetical protein
VSLNRLEEVFSEKAKGTEGEVKGDFFNWMDDEEARIQKRREEALEAVKSAPRLPLSFFGAEYFKRYGNMVECSSQIYRCADVNFAIEENITEVFFSFSSCSMTCVGDMATVSFLFIFLYYFSP